MSRRDTPKRTWAERFRVLRGALLRGLTTVLIVGSLTSIVARIYVATAWSAPEEVRSLTPSPPAGARYDQARSMRRIESALAVYRALHGTYPTDLEPLLIEGDWGGISPEDAELLRGAYYRPVGASFVLLPPTR